MTFREHIPSALPHRSIVDPYDPRRDKPWPPDCDDFFERLLNWSPEPIVQPSPYETAEDLAKQREAILKHKF